MASSQPYEPDGFDAANSNPFAHDPSLSQSVWGSPPSSTLDNDDSSSLHRDSVIGNSMFESALSPSRFGTNSLDNETETQESDSEPSTTLFTQSSLVPDASSAASNHAAPEPEETTSESQQQEQDKPTETSVADKVDTENDKTVEPNAPETTTKPAPPAAKVPRKKYKLTLKVTALERNGKKDPIIKFDAYTTLPRFRTNTYREIRRTHNEFTKFGSHLNNANPECFVPSVPPSFTSAGIGTEEDEIKVKRKLQVWLDRVSSNPILARDEEFVHFIESDFGYSPVYKKKPPATGMTRKALKQLNPPYDEVTELAEFRPVIKKLYLTTQETTAKIEKISKTRRNLGLALNDFGSKLAQYSATDVQRPGMVPMWRKLGKLVTGLGDLEAVKATTEAVTLSDGLNEVIQDAYVAKEALTNRHLIMRELAKSQANTKSKHQTAVKLRGSANINPLKVDEAISALEDATHVEENLTNKVRRVTENMLIEKKILSDRMEADIRSYIAEYTVRLIDSERRALSAWESIRPDVRAADSNGGLSRLGREAKPTRRRSDQVKSQSAKGDAWSGDRKTRAKDFGDPSLGFRNASAGGGKLGALAEDSFVDKGDDGTGNGDQLGDDGLDQGLGARRKGPKEDEYEDKEEDDLSTHVDARSAASLLGGSTF